MASRDDEVVGLEGKPIENTPLVSKHQFYGEKIKLFLLCYVPRSMFNIVALGFIFMILFTAFSPSQNLQSTITKGSSAGLYALGALYITFAVSNFISPTIVYYLGERLSMLAGAIGYAAFVGSNILDHEASYFMPLFVGAGMLNGLGAAILWTAQGSYITKNSSDATMGRNNGIFFGIFQSSQVFGNMIAAFVLPSAGGDPAHFKAAANLMFIIFTVIACVAVLSFLVLRPPPSKEGDIEKPHESFKDRFVGIFKMFGKRAFLLSILPIIYSGLSQPYFSANFTKLIDDSKRVSYVMAGFGVTDALASVGIGKMLDVFGRKIVLFISTGCVLIVTGIICLVPQDYFKANLWVSIVCGIIAGISDAGYNTLLTATTGSIFEDNPENAFGAFKLIQASTSAVNYVIRLDIYPATLLLDIFLILGTVSFFFLDYLHPKVDKSKKAINGEEPAGA